MTTTENIAPGTKLTVIGIGEVEVADLMQPSDSVLVIAPDNTVHRIKHSDIVSDKA